jgi:peptidoglycan/LPS O-acetylase OafA/YrhL
MADLAMGGWWAYGIFNSEKLRNFLCNLSQLSIVLVYISGIVFTFSMYNLNELSFFFAIFSRSLLCVFFAFIIVEQNYSTNSFYKVSNFKNFSKLGLYTYSLYMLHFMCIYVVNKVLDILKLNTHLYQVIIVQTLISFIASIIIGWLSYTYIERNFLKLKKRFSSWSASEKTRIKAIEAHP